MPLEYACIMPHGGDIIPQLAARKTKHLFVKTRESMRKIARAIREERPDTIVIASPHNLRLQGKIGIVTSENTAGQLNGPRGKKSQPEPKVRPRIRPRPPPRISPIPFPCRRRQ